MSSDSKKLRLVWLTNIPSPHHIAVLKKVAATEGIELKVLYCATTESVAAFGKTGFGSGYNYKLMPGVTLRFIMPWFHVNPTIVSEMWWNDYDAVIVQGFASPTMLSAMLSLSLRGKKWFFCAERIPWGDRGFLKKSAKQLIVPWILQHATRCHAVGSFAKDSFIRFGADPSRIDVIPYSYDASRFNTEVLPDADWEKRLEGKKTLLFTAQLIHRKAPDLMLRVFARLRQERDDVALLIAGAGPMQAQLEKFIEENNLKDIYLLGFVSQAKLPSLCRVADIFVLPSRYDGWAVVVAEALACGLPVITTNMVGAAHDLIQDGWNGFVVDVDDEEALYQRIKHLLDNPSLLANLKYRAPEKVKDILPDACARATVESVRKAFDE